MITSATIQLTISVDRHDSLYIRSREKELDKFYINELKTILMNIYFTNILFKVADWNYRSLTLSGNINGIHLIESINYDGSDYHDHERRHNQKTEEEQKQSNNDAYLKSITKMLKGVQVQRGNVYPNDSHWMK